MKKIYWVFLLIPILLMAGCAKSPLKEVQGTKTMVITNAWIRTSTLGRPDSPDAWKVPIGPLGLGPNGVLYLSIKNETDQPDRLLGAESPAAERMEVQRLVISGESGYSQPAYQVELPANETTELRADTLYLRMINLKQELKSGDVVNVTIQFEKAGKVTIQAVVNNP